MNISFRSIYKINNKDNSYDSFVQFARFAFDKDVNNDVKTTLTNTLDSISEYTMFAPDSMDSDIELYCANRGIKFTKLNINSQNIKKEST